MSKRKTNVQTPRERAGATGAATMGADANAATGGVSRRKLIGGAGAAGAAGLVLGAAGGATGYAVTRPDAPTALASIGSTEAMFHGKHQPGITTPLQASGHLVAFDLAAGAGRTEAAALMRRWSTLAGELMAGRPAAPAGTPGSPWTPARPP